jgi:hypothetical protein
VDLLFGANPEAIADWETMTGFEYPGRAFETISVP